jgi:hypothetical protein
MRRLSIAIYGAVLYLRAAHPVWYYRMRAAGIVAAALLVLAGLIGLLAALHGDAKLVGLRAA